MGVDIGGIIDSGTSIAGLISGAIIQDETQAELKKLQKDRPEYNIPSSIEAQLALLRRRSQTGLPGEDLIAGQIQQGTAQGVSASREAATSAADLLGATTNLYGQQTNALMDLQIQSARQQSQNELAYAQGLGTHGEYQDKAWNWNEAVDWQTNMNRVMGISQAAYDLQMGGLGGMSTVGSTVQGMVDSGGNNNNYSGYSDQAGYNSAMNASINYQPTSLGNGSYNGQTIGQQQYNPNGTTTLGQAMYGGGTWGS